MTNNIKAAASRSGLSPDEKKQVEGLLKAVTEHRTLLNLPSDQATTRFNNLPQNQQQSLVNFFGDDEDVKPERGWLQTAAHYAKTAALYPFTSSLWAVKKGGELSTQAFRTLQIVGDQQLAENKPVDFGKAWDIASPTGEKVFAPRLIAKAKSKYGEARVAAAMKIAGGENLIEAMYAEDIDEQTRQILASYSQGEVKDGLFEDALKEVQDARYSFGRAVADTLGTRNTPLFRPVSGAGDLAYMFMADPTVVGTKIATAYKTMRFGLDTMRGEKVAKVFADNGVKNFWNEYGSYLGKLHDATKAGDKEAAAIARTQLKRIAPEFPDEVIAELSSKSVNIRDAQQAQNYFENGADLFAMMNGQAARMVPLMPRLTPAREARLAMYTAADKVFNINKIGPDFLRAAYLPDEGVDDIITGITRQPVETAEKIKAGLATTRTSLAYLNRKIDSVMQKFEKVPYAADGHLDVTDPKALTFIYRTARLGGLPRYHSKIFTEAFNAADVGTKKEMFYGLWQTVGSLIGANKTKAGKDLIDSIKASADQAYAATVIKRDEVGKIIDEYAPGIINGKPMALGVWQVNNTVSVPSIRALQQAATRDGIIGRIIGYSQRKPVENATNWWTMLTIGGPRMIMRNGIEDFGLHISAGATPIGILQGRWASTTLRLAREGHDVGLINRFVRRADRSYYGNAARSIRDSKELTNNEKVEQLKELLATAWSEAKFTKSMSEEKRRVMLEQIRLGGIDNALREVSESSRQIVTGADAASRAITLEKEVGPIAALSFGDDVFVRGKGGYQQFSPAATPSSKASYIGLINTWANDELGRIAIPLLDGKGNKRAIEAVAEFLHQNPKIAAQFRLYENGVTKEEHAERLVDTVANLFSRNDGTFNREFYQKVVTPKGIKSADLSMEDLPESILDMPALVAGPTYIPVADAGQIEASLIERGWDWMGEASARYVREPVVFDTMWRIRKRMIKTGFEKDFIERYTANLSKDLGAEEAEKVARTALAEFVEQKAVAYTLSYVDNPAVRTQLALSARNFSRFYRAGEDFFRRMYRMTKYNPVAITRLALTYDGIAHSGWLKEDANGEKYFVYPGVGPVYTAMRNALKLFGVESEFKAPVPVQFGGKLNMISPSLDPNQLIPTFAGPLGALSMKVISNIVGLTFDKDAKTAFERVALGPYSVNQNTLEALIPAHIARVYQAMNREERDSQYASAMRKAVTYLEAAGKAPQPKFVNGVEVMPSAGELEQYQDNIKSVMASVLATRIIYGLSVPASPQLDYRSDMEDWVKASGLTSWRSAWIQMMKTHNNDFNKAMEQWVKYFPNKIPYTVSETEDTTVARIQASDQAGNFVDQNKELFKKYPEGAAFLMPLKGDFTYDAWKILRNNDFKVNKRVGDHLREVQTAGDMNTYMTAKREYEANLAATPYDWDKKKLREDWQAWKTSFVGVRPLLRARLAEGSENRPRLLAAIDDLKLMLDDKSVTVQPKARAALTEMVNLYNEFQRLKQDEFLKGNARDLATSAVVEQMQALAKKNINAGSAYVTLFSELVGDN